MPRSPGGATRLASYEEAWEAINRLIREGGSWSGFERNCLYLNAGDGTFLNASAASGLDFIEDGRAFAVLDLEADGDLDLVLKNRSGPQLRVLRNDRPPRPGRAAFRLTGRKANRDAVGARLIARAGSRMRVKSLKCGAGFLSQNSAWVHLAFPGAERIETLEILWPGGGRDLFRDLPLGRRYRIAEGEAPRSEEFRAGPGAAREGPRGALPEAPPGPPPGDGRREAWLLAALDLPDLAFEGAGGRPLHPRALRGRELLLSFFSPLCGACEGERREWEARREDIAASGLRLLLVEASGPGQEGSAGAAWVPPPEWLKLESESPAAFAAARAGPRAVAAYGVLTHQALRWPAEMSVPLSLLVDPRGVVAKLYRGPLDWPRLARDLALLRQAADARKLGLPFPGTWHTGGPQRDHFQLGLGYVEAGLHDLARAAFRRAIELRPADAESLFNLGVTLGGLGPAGPPPPRAVLEEARECFERAVGAEADFPDAHSNLGVVLAKLGDLAGAELRFLKALELRPGHAEALLNLGNLRIEQGRVEEALERFREAARAEPGEPAPWKRIGEVARRLGRAAEAVGAFREAVALDPQDAEARSNLAVVLAETGELGEAARELEAAVRARPGYAAALNNLGLVQERAGDHAKARASFRAAIAADGALAEPRLNLARSLVRAGERKQAAETLRALLGAQLGHLEAARLLAELGERP